MTRTKALNMKEVLMTLVKILATTAQVILTRRVLSMSSKLIMDIVKVTIAAQSTLNQVVTLPQAASTIQKVTNLLKTIPMSTSLKPP
jgi:hypothetical protein